MKKELKIGIFVFAVVLIFTYFVIKTQSLLSLFSSQKTYTIFAKFNNVSGLFKRAPVRLAGIRIGLVEDIFLKDNAAVVKMKISQQFEINTNARAKTSMTGIVGENFIEIVYREEFFSAAPKKIEDSGEIITVPSFDLDAMGFKINNIINKTSNLLDSVNETFSDAKSKESLSTSLLNIRSITENLKLLSEKDGNLNQAMQNFNALGTRLKQSVESIDSFFSKADRSFFQDEKGVVVKLDAAIDEIKTISRDLKILVEGLKEGTGTAGKLIRSDELYQNIDDSVKRVNQIVKDFEKKKESLDRTRVNYFAGIDYFTRLEQARFQLGLTINFKNINIFSRVNEDPTVKKPQFSLVVEKPYSWVTVAAGMIDSGLGAMLTFHLIPERLDLCWEASRFTELEYPNLKTIGRLSLSKNIQLQAGFERVLEKNQRKFIVGISVKN